MNPSLKTRRRPGWVLAWGMAVLLPHAVFSQSEPLGWIRFPDGDMIRADPVLIEEDDWWLNLHHAHEPVQILTPVQVWLSHKTDVEEEGFHRILFRNGDILTGTLTGWTASGIRFRTYWGEEVTLRETVLSAIEFREPDEHVVLKGPAPLSDWTQRTMNNPSLSRYPASALEVGGAVHFQRQNRNHLTRTLENLPTRFRLQAEWTSRYFGKLRHTLNLYRNRGLDAQTPNIVVNFSQGNAQVVTTAAHMRNREEISLGNKSDRQSIELYMDSESEEWSLSINGTVRLRNTAKAMVLDSETAPSSVDASRQLRWYSYSQDPIVFEFLRIEEWSAAFPSAETDAKKIPKGKAGILLRNGDTLLGSRLQMKDEVLTLQIPGIDALPVPLRVVKRIDFRKDRWASHPIGAGRYLVTFRDKTSRLRLRDLRLTEEFLAGEMAGGVTVQIPLESVYALQAGPRQVSK